MSTFIKWIITIYVVSILAWSGLLRAQEVIITNANFDQDHFELTLAGRVSNYCGLSLKTKIIENQFTEEGPLALIEIANRPNVQACPLNNKQQTFDLLIDVRSLGLKPGYRYGLTFANSFGSFNTPIYTVDIPSNSFFSDYQPRFASGVVSQNNQGEWVLLQGINEVMILKTKLDLSKYLGQFVSIEGTEILHRTGPILNEEERFPLHRATPSSSSPTVYLFSISTAAY